MLGNRVEIELSDNPVANIQMMAPMLSEKQQYMVLGMILAQVGNKKQDQHRLLAAGTKEPGMAG